MDYANVPDINIIVNGSEEQAQIEDWLKNEAPGVTAYGHNSMISMMEKDIHMEKDGDASAFTTDGASLYMATTDADYCKVFDTAGRPLDLQAGEIGHDTVTHE